jgi:hypothetical protein
MDNETENFEQLQKLLTLKKHELPPPGYFNSFSGNVISRIRAERSKESHSVKAIQSEATWLLRFWNLLEARPMFAGAFGATVCGLILFGIVMAVKPEDRSNFAGAALPAAPALNNSAELAGSAGLNSPDQPVLLASNLFQMVPSPQTAPVGFKP